MHAIRSATVPTPGRCSAGAPDPRLRRLRRRGQDHDRRDARAGGRAARQAHAGPARSIRRKRLANSLGLAALGHQVQEVDPRAGPHAARRATGELHAMMLDQKHGVRRGRRSATPRIPAAVKRILANPVYAQISGSLAGAQEYAAMAKLHDFDRSGQWDPIVVDTPPTAHALDFLDAPRKLSEAIDSPAIEWFRKLQGEGGLAVVARRQDRRVRAQAAREVRRLASSSTTSACSSPSSTTSSAASASAPRRRSRCSASRASASCSSRAPSRWPCARRSLPRAARRRRRCRSSASSSTRSTLPCRSRADATAIEAALAAHPGVAALGLSGTTRTMAAQALFAAHAELETLADADRARDRQAARRRRCRVAARRGAAAARRRPRRRPPRRPRALPARVLTGQRDHQRLEVSGAGSARGSAARAAAPRPSGRRRRGSSRAARGRAPRTASRGCRRRRR